MLFCLVRSWDTSPTDATLDRVIDLHLRVDIKSLFSIALLLIAALAAAGCTHSAIEPDTLDPEIPSEWQRGGAEGGVELNWLTNFDNPQIRSLVAEAIANNYSLHEEKARLYQAEQSISHPRRFPRRLATRI